LRADADVFKLYVNTGAAINRSRRVSYDKQVIIDELRAKVNELKREVDEKSQLAAAQKCVSQEYP
jgi:hypothetical protein